MADFVAEIVHEAGAAQRRRLDNVINRGSLGASNATDVSSTRVLN
jgi:hypothetical protein